MPVEFSHPWGAEVWQIKVLAESSIATAIRRPKHQLLTSLIAGHKIVPMGRFFDTIRGLVADDRYVIGEHASERLEERGIMEWQAVTGLESGELIAERPGAKPHSVVEVLELLPDGTEFKAVWSHLPQSGVAKLVTVHFFD